MARAGGPAPRRRRSAGRRPGRSRAALPPGSRAPAPAARAGNPWWPRGRRVAGRRWPGRGTWPWGSSSANRARTPAPGRDGRVPSQPPRTRRLPSPRHSEAAPAGGRRNAPEATVARLALSLREIGPHIGMVSHDDLGPLPLRYRTIRRLRRPAAGRAACGVSSGLLVESARGNVPWDVFRQGVARASGPSLGAVMIVVGGLVPLRGWPLRQHPGLGTVSNVVVVAFAAEL